MGLDACARRAAILELAAEVGVPFEQRRVSLAQFHSADEAFTTGTMGEVSHGSNFSSTGDLGGVPMLT